MVKVVRKEFKPQRKDSEYELELRNLSILRLLKHPNIIQLLGSYTYRGKHNLIFPLARGGTLTDLIRKPRPPLFKSDEKIIIALSGLCSAVCAVHRQFSDDHTLLGIGCHHDLKPKNIFVDEDKFLLADFGLSRFKTATEDSDTSYKHVGGDYVAPECEGFEASGNINTKTIIGRPSDVWSLGCIMAEVLVYMKMGPEGVARFEDERKFRIGPLTIHRFHRGLKEEEPVVVAYLADLLEKSNTRSERLLNELVRHTLQLNPKARPTAEEIETRMWFIAIDTISQQILELYARVLQKGESPQAFIEQERFASWIQSCETIYAYQDSSSSNRWKARSSAEFQKTLDSLIAIRDTLEAIIPEVKKPNRLVYRPLEDLNDSLLDSLPDELQASAQRHLEIQILGANLQNLPKEVLHHSRGPELQRIGMLMTIKEMSLFVDQRSQTRRPDLWILPQRLSGQKKVGDHYIAKLDNSDNGTAVKVLYESKKYGEHQLDKSIREELHTRLEAIAELLQKATANGFRVLHCYGYFHDPAKLSCGLIYKLPTQLGLDDPDVVTLRTILAERRTLPDLGKRFSLAHNLAASILEFHKVRWLQKEISSFNITFVFPKGSSWRNGIDKPYFLGFSSSRPNEPKAFSDYKSENARALMDFQHPEYLKGDGKIRYRPEFDYYSLGMVLLEIGHWKPLDTIIAKIPGSPEDVLIELQKVQVPQLGQYLGVIYRNVVKACLSGEFGGSGNVDKESESCIDNFARTVVEPLGKYVV
jgi:serine/threonine protein kinase